MTIDRFRELLRVHLIGLQGYPEGIALPLDAQETADVLAALDALIEAAQHLAA